MNTLNIFIVFAMITSLATGSIFAVSPVFAAKDSGSNGLEIADDNVHENTGGLSPQDFSFHEGICQGGHSTEALEEVTGGVGCDALNSPGNSNDHRQD
ncbi:MAG: hypothetical protein H0U27_08175 [Nitrosopumilus sp.]|nr:hypothetical protein [Nitrosopumilus sp.]